MRGLILIISLAGVLAGVARADDADVAKRYYALGTRLYDAGKYKDAAEAYSKSYLAKSDPSLLYYIGQSYRLAGLSEEALRSYKSFLQKQPSSPLRSEVEGYVAALEKPAPAPVKVAPAPVEKPAPAPVVVQAAPSPAPVAARDDRPIYKRWWLWTAVAAVAVAGVAVGVGLAFALPNDAAAPAGAYTVRFP